MNRSKTLCIGGACATACFLLALPLQTLGQEEVAAGYDLFQTDPGATFQDFALIPLPADFFWPGSDPFDGTVVLMGAPPGASPTCPLDHLENVDTIVERKDPAVLPPPPSQDTIDIEIVALHLKSITPITVTFNGGQDPEEWDLDVELSPTLPSVGQMTIHHTHPSGGTFQSDFQVVPIFTFTKVNNPQDVRVLDLGQFAQSIPFTTQDVPWEFHQPPEGTCTSNFCVNPGALTVHQSQFAAHGVISICPEGTVPADTINWGRVKSLYR